jgi:superfamily I DNA/RNA helicase
MIRCNKESNGAVIDRLTRIYPFVFVDEVQDLAGYDLDILAALFQSPANVVMVGDPRQVTYVTHLEARLKKYRDGGIADFIRSELPRKVACDIDVTSLVTSHRNSTAICELSSKLYPKLVAATACKCPDCGQPAPVDAGLFIVRRKDLPRYLETRRPVQLRWNSTVKVASPDLPTFTFGRSKGLGFDHVIIYPTKEIMDWLKNPQLQLKAETRAKLYVGLTRARHSVAVVYDPSGGEIVAGFTIFE